MRRAAPRVVVVVMVVVLLATACAPRRDVAEPAVRGDLPVGYYRDAIARGEPVFRIDGATSLVTVYVYRDGPLARLGHDHVVASRDVRGFAAAPADPTRARADLSMPIPTLIVDAADLRAEAGFESSPSADDIAGTRENMLESLDADAFPAIGLAATLAAPLPEPRLSVELNLHGTARKFDVPVALSIDADRLEVSGSFEVRQSEFGIEPFSVFGGALKVADRLNVAFRLRAVRVSEIP
jgi:hypothetical protein